MLGEYEDNISFIFLGEIDAGGRGEVAKDGEVGFPVGNSFGRDSSFLD